jgi:hypothetical protein
MFAEGTNHSGAARKYLLKLFIAVSAYVAILWFSIHQLQHNPSLPWKYGIAVLPVVPLLFVPVAVVQFLREQDELQRKMQGEALAIGFTASVVITLTYGFLENAGVPRLSWVWVWPVMAFFWCIGLVVAHRRYR